MGGFANSISNNVDCVFANNADFSGSVSPSDTNGLQTNGQLWVGSTALNGGGTHVNVGAITSPLGTVTIGYSSPNITLDIAGGAAAIEKVNVQTGTSPIVPSGGIITLNGAVVAAGTNPIRTDGTGLNTIAIEVQTSQAIAAADATKIGLSNFDSASFSVAATGFVTLSTAVPKLFTANSGTATPSANNLNVLGGGGIQTAGSGATLTIAVSGGGFTWNNTTGSSATLSAQNGYFSNNAGAVTYTLPTTVSSSTGDTVVIIGLGAGGWTIAQLASQQIIVGSAATTVGITGSVSSTNRYDTIRLVYSPTSGLWRAESFTGNLTVA